MNTLTRKSWAAIYVANEMYISDVEEIIKELDAFEYDYLPDDLIKPFSDYPQVAYTHKFSDLDMDLLTIRCWERGIYIWVYDAREEYPSDQRKLSNLEE